jgi:ankyrin repeat protein
MIASSAGHIELVKYLIDEKCDVNHKNLNGLTSLHYACSRDRLEVINSFLRKHFRF